MVGCCLEVIVGLRCVIAETASEYGVCVVVAQRIGMLKMYSITLVDSVYMQLECYLRFC